MAAGSFSWARMSPDCRRTPWSSAAWHGRSRTCASSRIWDSASCSSSTSSTSSIILPTRSSSSTMARRSPKAPQKRSIRTMKSSAPISDGRPLLEFKDVDTYYGELHVLKKVNYEIRAGEIVCLLVGNASGKSTTMKTVLGIVQPRNGTVTYDGIDISKLRTAERVKRGIAPVPEARRLFPKMTVLENLEMGAFTRSDTAGIAEDVERVYTLFPRVAERRGQIAGTLSGGEQQ